jgi:hypothetical protein
MHGDVFGKFVKIIRLGDEIGFAVDFHHDTDLSAHVDVGLNGAFGGGAAGPFGGSGDPFFSEKIDAFSRSPSHSQGRLYNP